VGTTCQRLRGAGGYHFGRGRLTGWAGFGHWAETAPPALFYLFFSLNETFFFCFEIRNVLLVNKIA
jgi:hypothetical protein